jgi:hypothetical protein
MTRRKKVQLSQTPDVGFAHGEAIQIDWEQSLHVGRLLRAEKGECFQNAAMVVLALNHRMPDAIYVEGYLMPWHGQVIPHGWARTKEGVWLDPTQAIIRANPELQELTAMLGFDHIPEPRYVAAGGYQARTVVQAVQRNRTFPLLRLDRPDRPDLGAAQIAAHQLVNGDAPYWPMIKTSLERQLASEIAAHA